MNHIMQFRYALLSFLVWFFDDKTQASYVLNIPTDILQLLSDISIMQWEFIIVLFIKAARKFLKHFFDIRKTFLKNRYSLRVFGELRTDLFEFLKSNIICITGFSWEGWGVAPRALPRCKLLHSSCRDTSKIDAATMPVLWTLDENTVLGQR